MSFARYESYKDSGVEWLGDVPSGWEVKALKREFAVVGGATPKSDQEDYWDGDLVWITPADLGKNADWYITDTQRRITEVGLASCAAELVPADAVILSTRAPIGSLGITATSASTNQGCKALVGRGAFDARLLAYFLSSATADLNVRGRGTTFLELSGEELGRFAISVPPLEDQRTIADFLDRETAKIDALVEAQRRLIALLKEKRQAVISHAVTKGLDPSAPLKPSGIDWLGDVPAHWKVMPLRYLIKCCDGQRIPLNAEQRADRSGDIPYWGANSIMDYIDGALFDEELALLGEDGAPFLEQFRQKAFLSKGPVWPNNHIHVLRPREAGSAGWLVDALNATDYAVFIQGSTRDKLTQSSMMSIPIAWPDEAERALISDFLTSEKTRFATLIDAAELVIALLTERRAALISAAVTGKIDVRDLAAATQGPQAQ